MELKNDMFVIIGRVGGDRFKLIKIRKGQKISVDRIKFDPTCAIGLGFGIFEVFMGRLKTLENTLQLDQQDRQCDEPELKKPKVKFSGSNSCSITNLDNDDTISSEQISQLKSFGMSTNCLVSKLVERNRMFQARTPFAKRKYVNKKTSKYSDKILILKPTLRLIAETYYNRNPERIGYLRMDILSLILQLSGIHFGSKVFVYEQVLGIVGSSMIEKLAGSGDCIFLHHGEVPQSIPGIVAMEYESHKMQVFLPLRISTILSRKIVDFETAKVKASSDGNMGQIFATAESDDAISSTSTDGKAVSIFKKNERMDRERRALGLLTPFPRDDSILSEYGKIENYRSNGCATQLISRP